MPTSFVQAELGSGQLQAEVQRQLAQIISASSIMQAVVDLATKGT
jgi:hypothetical protein